MLKVLFASQFASFQGSLSRFCVGGKCSSWKHCMQFRSPAAAPASFLFRRARNAGTSPTARREGADCPDAACVHIPTKLEPLRKLQLRRPLEVLLAGSASITSPHSQALESACRWLRTAPSRRRVSLVVVAAPFEYAVCWH